MYQNLVGNFIYMSHTWPDTAYAVSVISQFMYDPEEAHLEVAHSALKYLKRTLERISFLKEKEV